MPFDDHLRQAEAADQPRDVLEHVVHVRVVGLLDLPAVDVLDVRLVEVPAVGIEVDDDGLGDDLVGLGAELGGRLRREAHSVLVTLRGVLRFLGQLLDDAEVHHLVERDGLVLDRADATVQVVGL